MDDMELLREWAEQGSDEAFRTLVERHLNLVYSVARRSVPTVSQAEEVTQTVFIILARKAHGLSPRTVLSGWLYRTTRFAALELLRGESRRESRREALADMEPADAHSLWPQLAPVLEEALDQMPSRDRDALVLRFMEERSLREVGRTLGVSEEAARKRVERSLEKLRALLARRGVTTSTALLSGALTTNAVLSAPGGLAHSVTREATASALATSTAALVKATLSLMAWQKIKAAGLVALVLLLCPATAYVLRETLPRRESVAREVGGFGLALGRNGQGAPTILIVVDGSAAQRAGLSKGLILRSIGGVPTVGMKLQECVRRIEGRPGTIVELELTDPQRGMTNLVRFTRPEAAQNVGGIGIALGRDESTAVAIMDIVPNSPAAGAGLSKGLVIHAVDGVATTDLNPRECLNRIQGPPGSRVQLEIIHPRRNLTNIVELTRLPIPGRR